MKVDVVIQARLNSYRFQNKILKKIKNKTIIELLYSRLKLSKKINKIIFAIPKNSKEKKLKNLLIKLGANYFEGSENNVLKRFYDCVKKYNSEVVVRITADCPLIDPFLLDKMIKIFENNKYDYLSNTINPTFPNGLDIEIFHSNILFANYKKITKKYDKEHVTSFFRRNKKISKYSFTQKNNYSKYRLTIDYYKDYLIVKKIFENFLPKINFNTKKLMSFIFKEKIAHFDETNFDPFANNKNITKKKIWNSVKKFIFEKSLPPDENIKKIIKYSNKFYKKYKGAFIWDFENNKYLDFSLIGTRYKIKSKAKYDLILSQLKYNIKKTFKKNKIEIELYEMNNFLYFEFKNKNNYLFKRLLSIKFLENKIFSTNVIFVSDKHTKKNIDKYIKCLNNILKIIKEYEDGRETRELHYLYIDE